MSPYTITLGDEFQAVVSGADWLFRDALKIILAIHPVGVRFSFGVGTIDTPINAEQAIGMDGPAFHNARSGIEELKRTKNVFAVSGLDTSVLGLSNQSLALISHMGRRWNTNRLRVLLGLLGGTAVKDIAPTLGVSEQAVYKSIEAGALRTIVQLFDELTTILNRTVRQG